MNAKKLIALLLAVVMVFGLVACAGNNDATTTTGSTTPDASGESTPDTTPAGEAASYTYKTYSLSLGTNWNPHSWESNGDDAIQQYLNTPLASMSIQDSENGIYQWIYEAATSVEDVTADNQDVLEKYGVTLPEGETYADQTDGYVFEIKLNPDMKWEDGTPINADTYIYSMKALLDPDMKNYRANLYYSGESAVAGGDKYYYAGSTVWIDAVSSIRVEDLVLGEDGTYATADGVAVAFSTSAALEWLGGNSLTDYVEANGDAMFDTASFESLVALGDDEGYVPVTDETIALMTNVITFSADWGETAENISEYLTYAETYADCEYEDTVGCYKVDDYTIHYVTQAWIDINYFLVSCSSNWLVYEDLYEAGKTTEGDLVTTNYCTSQETTMSYGPYKIESLQTDKQIVFVQNEEWFGYEKQADGSLISYTNFDVDGAPVQQYQTTKIVIDVMDDAAAKQAFLKGELSEWSPSGDDLLAYATSDQLYKVDQTYTQSFFFNCGLENLQAMDEAKGNTNSVVLSNINFRKAFSLAIDREEYVGATSGYKPAYSLMNNLYFYNVYEDPNSSYRNSEPAMQAICNLYGVEYGEGTPYATLKDAYQSINGYNLTEAQELMKTAFNELVEAGLYTEGEDIHIRIGWSQGALDSAANQQVALMNKYINAAAEGSGFGTITLEAVGNIANRYDDVANGEYAIGYGAWGGAAFYPFRNFQVYCDTEQYSVNEVGCWDPATETLTLNVEGEDVTMTWQDWSRALVGTGKFSGASNETKLQITASMEEEYLKKYYRIPLCSTTSCFMLSYQLSYYTEDYNIMYDFGGLRLMTYNYTDAEWADFVAENNGTLSYE